MPKPKNITITITGPTKSGKTSAAGVIERALKDYGATVVVEDLDIVYVNPARFEDDSLLDFVTATVRTETTKRAPAGTELQHPQRRYFPPDDGLPGVATFAPMGGYPNVDRPRGPAVAQEAGEVAARFNETSAEVLSPPVDFNLYESLHQIDALHPTGRCTCGGEGRCAWCKDVEKRGG